MLDGQFSLTLNFHPESPVQVVITDVNGAELMRYSNTSILGNISLSEPGTYFVIFQSPESRHVERLVVQ